MTEQSSTTELRDIRAIVIDLDGTLLNSDHQMTDRTRDTIRRAIDAGKTVFIATGKTRASALPIIEALDLKTPGVYVQELIIFNGDGTIRSEKALEPAVARRVINFAQNNQLTVIAYDADRLLMQSLNETADLIHSFGEPMPEAVGPLINLIGKNTFHKVVLIGNSWRQIKAARWQLDQIVGDQVHLTTAKVLTSVEVLPRGVSKGSGVKKMLREIGINLDNVMAIGDGENDVEMLEAVGWGVAMSNADDKLKAVADVVVDSNDEDGVATAIERFVIGPAPEPTPQPTDAPAPEPADETPKTEADDS